MTMQVSVQSEYHNYHFSRSSTSQKYVSVEIGQSEIRSETIPSVLASMIIKEMISLEPVYVKKNDGVETLIYNSNMMESGKRYPVMWNNEQYMLIKNYPYVDIYRFYPDP